MTEAELRIVRVEMRVLLMETLVAKLLALTLTLSKAEGKRGLQLAREVLSESAKHVQNLYAKSPLHEASSALYADEFREITEQFEKHVERLYASISSSKGNE